MSGMVVRLDIAEAVLKQNTFMGIVFVHKYRCIYQGLICDGIPQPFAHLGCCLDPYQENIERLSAVG